VVLARKHGHRWAVESDTISLRRPLKKCRRAPPGKPVCGVDWRGVQKKRKVNCTGIRLMSICESEQSGTVLCGGARELIAAACAR